MRRITLISSALWACFFAAHFILFILTYVGDKSSFSAMSTMGLFIEMSAGLFVSVLAYLYQRRWMFLALALVSLVVLWKLHVGAIVFFMMPQMGGLSFADAISKWWTMGNDGIRILRALELVFFATSSVLWLMCSLLTRNRQNMVPIK